HPGRRAVRPGVPHRPPAPGPRPLTATTPQAPRQRRRTIGFRSTAEDERIIKAAMRPGERTSDVIRRALRLLEREVWLAQARSDAERLAVEDPSGEADAW